MKPHLIDRLLTIVLCLGLALSLWCVSVTFAANGSTASLVF